MILLCYDGSPDARVAIERAGELLGGQPATVLTVWEPFAEVMARASYGFAMASGSAVDIESIDKATREAAEERAREGAALAELAGFNAKALAVASTGTIADTILGQADALGASAIAMGTRGLTGVKSLLLGSVSHAVIQHADRTVIVVPSSDVAAARARGRAQR
jgi:nucleotide-binding universal stress UspA family protein